MEYLNIPYHRKRSGLNHLVFHIDTNAEIDEMTIKLKEKGITILYEHKHPYAGGETILLYFLKTPIELKLKLFLQKNHTLFF